MGKLFFYAALLYAGYKYGTMNPAQRSSLVTSAGTEATGIKKIIVDGSGNVFTNLGH